MVSLASGHPWMTGIVSDHLAVDSLGSTLIRDPNQPKPVVVVAIVRVVGVATRATQSVSLAKPRQEATNVAASIGSAPFRFGVAKTKLGQQLSL